jgi:hypothetical protein
VSIHNPYEISHFHCVHCDKNGHEENTCRIPCKKIEEDKAKTSEPMEGKAPTHYVVSHCNIGVTEEFFNTSYGSWGDAFLLDTGETSHMKFRRDFFEDFDDNVDGIVYFANR